jgi:hypothetical protein
MKFEKESGAVTFSSEDFTMRFLTQTSTRLLVATLAVLALCVSCSRDDSPTAPPASDMVSDLNLIPIAELPGDGPALGGGEIHLFAWDKVTPEEGGDVSTGLIRVVVPPGAVDDPTILWIQRDPDYAMADFGPDGTHFQVPVEIRFATECLDLDGVSAEELSIYWYNPAARRWKRLPSELDHETMEVLTEVDHFSRYALSD